MGNIIVPTLYHSTTGDVIYRAPVFVYSIDMYRIYKKYTELMYSSYKFALKPINLVNQLIYKKYKDYTISTSIDLYGAPISYLESNGYTPYTKDEYKNYIKLRRKNGHKVL